MADALDSKSSARKGVWVQVPPPVLKGWLVQRDVYKSVKNRASRADQFTAGTYRRVITRPPSRYRGI